MMDNVIPQDYRPIEDPFPFKAPFILSSMERFWCNAVTKKSETPGRIVFIKRRHLEENLKIIAGEIGMDADEQKRFLDYWCSANGEEVRAEGDRYFDLRQRAQSWMSRRRPAEKKQQQSRVQQYADTSQIVTQMIHGLIDTAKDTTAGSAVPPDEQ